ncbi:MAG: hypothetical protein ABJI60_06480 [Kangiellaceae bacterium]
MKIKIFVGILLIVIFSISVLTSIPSGLKAADEYGIAYAIGRILGGNLFSFLGIVGGIVLYKIGKTDLELSKNTSGQSFSDITKRT